MFANSYQRGFLCIFSSVGSRPLSIWGNQVSNGHIKRVVDQEVKSLVLEVCGTNVATTFIYSPPNEKGSLGIRLPYFIMVIKNLKRYFSFEIEILDDRRNRRRFRVSNYQSQTAVHTFTCHMPLGLNPGWNQVQFNLADFTRKAYGSTYMETRRIQIHANCRIRCIYFADKIYSEDELPPEFKLYMPLSEKRSKTDKRGSGKKDDAKHPSKEKLDEETAMEEGKEAPKEEMVPKEEAKAILDMITNMVMNKISSLPKESEGATPAMAGASLKEPPSAPEAEVVTEPSSAENQAVETPVDPSSTAQDPPPNSEQPAPEEAVPAEEPEEGTVET